MLLMNQHTYFNLLFRRWPAAFRSSKQATTERSSSTCRSISPSRYIISFTVNGFDGDEEHLKQSILREKLDALITFEI